MKLKKHIMLFFGYAFFLLLAHRFIPIDSQWMHSMLLVTPFFVFIYGYDSLKFFGFSSYQGKTIFFITLAIFLAWVGRIIWTLSDEALVSTAHIFYFALRPAFALAIFYALKIINPDFFNDKKRMMKIYFSAIALLAAYFLIFQFTNNASLSALENLILFGYYIADSFLFAFIVLAAYFVIVLSRGTYKYHWLALGAGAFTFLISQIYYVQNYLIYQTGQIVDTGWCFGYLLFALSFILAKKESEKSIELLKKHFSQKKRG